MSARNAGILRPSLALLRPKLLLKQLAIAALVVLLSLVWLRLPDSSAFWIALTALLGLAVLVIAGGAETFVLLSLAHRPRTRPRIALGILMLVVAAGLWYGSGRLIEHLSAKDDLVAGYLNSRFGQHARYFFTYEHLQLWFAWAWSALQTLFDGLILAVCFAPIAAIKPARGIARTLGSLAYWIVVIVTCLVVPAITGGLEHWVPGHGLTVESISLILRMFAVVAFDILSLSLLIATLAVCAQRANEPYIAATPAGTPDASQPRTADIP